jgi:hypothetical protein
MKEIALFIVLLCMALQNTAQEAKKTTVHITKVENINGVSKFTDTTYTTDDPKVFLDDQQSTGDKNVTVMVTENLTGNDENGKKTGNITKTIVFSDTLNGEDVHTITNINGDLNPEMLKALEEAHSGKGFRVESNSKGSHASAIVLSDGMSLSTSGGSRSIKKIYVVKTVKITDASDAETKRLKKEAGPTNGKLSLGDMKFSPNPANGKFTLSFSTPGKGDAEITILNSEGKKVYTESLPGFNGHYNKEIDISENPKGVYFVRIQQGDHSQMKKLVIE